ncbi:hypothetical protein ABPG74_006794 [Tetrahymena malaccensis]
MISFKATVIALIFQLVYGVETISTFNSDNQLSIQITLNLGTPAIPLTPQVQFGTNSMFNFGQYFFDQSIQQTSQILYEQIQQSGIEQLYDITKSSTSQIESPFLRQDNYNGGSMQGNYVNDILSFKNIKTIFNFACVQTAINVYQIYSSGIIIFNRLSENIFDQMYRQNTIKTSDYILSGSQYIVNNGNFTYSQNKIEITFDLDPSSDYYSFPSNPLVSGIDTFQIMAYGIYINGEDLTEQLKHRRISIDQITQQSGYIDDQTYVPQDLFQILQQKYNLPNRDYSYYNCANCQCQEVQNLPEITLFTEQYIIKISPDQYTSSFLTNQCQLNLVYSDTFQISSALLFHSNKKIMYQKSSNSIKIFDVELINHLNLNSIIVTFSIFSGLSLIILIYLSLQIFLKFKSHKLEMFHKKEKCVKVFEENKKK